MKSQLISQPSELQVANPRLGFLGVGWIGRHRMEAIGRCGVGEIAAIADASPEMCAAAAASAPDSEICTAYEDLLDMDLDGVVIATPSALHAEQSIRALENGVAVFCQKPLGRTAEEARQVIAAAREADRLLGVDLSYRFTEAMREIRSLVQRGEIGSVYAADLVFHNAYGPDKDWFYDVSRSGGGCVMDLGIHLVDLALWTLDFPAVDEVTSRLFAGGTPLEPDADRVEDFAVARLDLAGGGIAQLACSWNLPAGREAVIEATFFGTEGALAMRNVAGSFYDFTAERFRGTQRELLLSPPDEWGGRAAVAWARQLAESPRFDAQAEDLIDLSEVLDRIYRR